MWNYNISEKRDLSNILTLMANFENMVIQHSFETTIVLGEKSPTSYLYFGAQLSATDYDLSKCTEMTHPC